MVQRRLGNVWIVGASSGIGASLAKLADDRADHIAVSARSKEGLESVANSGQHIVSYPLDVTDHEAAYKTAEEIEQRFGSIDLAVFCAGVWHPMSADSMDIDKMRQTMEINYFGAVNIVNAVLPGMKKQGSGHIVIVSSVAGYRGLPTAAAYGSSKAALSHLTETLTVELRKYGIVVTLVNPGFVDTPMSRVNTYKMPGIISSEAAAEKMLDGILKQKPAIFFPFGFTTFMRALNFLPYRVFYWLAGRIGGEGKNQ
ncbi:MAG: SDR family NAD(P)-dependent oxidoreductase [Pseudomonadota bacterium]